MGDAFISPRENTGFPLCETEASERFCAEKFVAFTRVQLWCPESDAGCKVEVRSHMRSPGGELGFDQGRGGGCVRNASIFSPF